MTDKEAVVERLDAEFRHHAWNVCGQCRDIAYGQDAAKKPDRETLRVPDGLCDEGKRLLQRSYDALQSCDICSVDWKYGGGRGVFRIEIQKVIGHVVGRTLLLCDTHMGAFAKHLEARWPWREGAFMHEPNDPNCGGSCHGKWKWAVAVQRWFFPFFQMIATDVAADVTESYQR